MHDLSDPLQKCSFAAAVGQPPGQVLVADRQERYLPWLVLSEMASSRASTMALAWASAQVRAGRLEPTNLAERQFEKGS